LGRLEGMPVAVEVEATLVAAEEAESLVGALWVMMAAGNQLDVDAVLVGADEVLNDPERDADEEAALNDPDRDADADVAAALAVSEPLELGEAEPDEV
jgi:hypothetical protein